MSPRSMEQKPGGRKYLNTVCGVIWVPGVRALRLLDIIHEG